MYEWINIRLIIFTICILKWEKKMNESDDGLSDALSDDKYHIFGNLLFILF